MKDLILLNFKTILSISVVTNIMSRSIGIAKLDNMMTERVE